MRFQPHKPPCRLEGYVEGPKKWCWRDCLERSNKTNRCLKPCAKDQQRSRKTNRCGQASGKPMKRKTKQEQPRRQQQQQSKVFDSIESLLSSDVQMDRKVRIGLENELFRQQAAEKRRLEELEQQMYEELGEEQKEALRKVKQRQQAAEERRLEELEQQMYEELDEEQKESLRRVEQRQQAAEQEEPEPEPERFSLKRKFEEYDQMRAAEKYVEDQLFQGQLNATEQALDNRAGGMLLDASTKQDLLRERDARHDEIIKAAVESVTEQPGFAKGFVNGVMDLAVQSMRPAAASPVANRTRSRR